MKQWVDRPAIAGIAIVISLWGTPAASQQSRLPIPSDDHRTYLAEAQQAADAGNFADAVDRWQAVLDLPEDYFDPATPGRSLRTRAEDALRTLLPPGRDAYELRFGPQARAILNDALRDNDRQRLNEVVRRFFYTDAGHAAAIVLAQALADAGETLSAAQLYDRLALHPRTTPNLQSDWRLRAAICWRLAGFESSSGEPPAVHAQPQNHPTGRPLTAEAQAQLARLPAAKPGGGSPLVMSTTWRGNPQRNAAYAPAVPVGPLAWDAAVVERTDSDDRFESPPELRTAEVSRRMSLLAERYATATGERVLLPVGAALAADGLVVYRGPASIKAVSLATGRTAWSCIRIDDTFHHLLDQEWLRRDEDWYGGNLNLLLAQRMWRDASAASLSSDGELVYAVVDGGMISSIMQSAVALPALSDHPLAPHAHNRLLAIELRTGRIRWEAGGPPTDVTLSGAFFLGAPLPLDGQLYCLVEEQGQVQLVVLEPQKSGPAVAWSQALYNPAANLSNPAIGVDRRLAGLTPSALGDVVVCPTGETTVVAVDRRRRALLWAHEYRKPAYEVPKQALAIRMLIDRQQSRGRLEDQLLEQLLEPDHWQDSAAILHAEYVLHTPPDSQDLLCLRLLDGSLAWRQPRGQRQFIAAVHDGRVVVVGAEQVEALRLDSGEPAWPDSLPIPKPAGRGFQHGRLYVLPLITGEAAAIDLETGRLVARTSLPVGCSPGNFTAADGRIVCQTANGVYGFRSLRELTAEANAQLAGNPTDVAALIRRAEIRLQLGAETDALVDLRQAVALAPASPARRLLATTLIEGLRADFDAYRAAAPEIEQLVADIADQTLFHRLYAAGLQQRGELEGAFQQYLKFAGAVAESQGLQRIDGARQVRTGLWISGRLEELLESADPAARDRLHAELARTVDAALASDDLAHLSALRQVIPDPRERRRIDQRLIQSPLIDELTTEVALLDLLNSPIPAQASLATARLADRWLAAGRRSQFLDRLLAQLGGPLNSAPCLHGRTGGELIAAWRDDPRRAPLIDPQNPWPTAHVDVKEHVRNLPLVLPAVRHLGPRSELLAGWCFVTDPAGSKLVAFDQFGRPAWQVPTGRTGLLPGRRGPNYIRYITTFGRLVLLVVEDQWTLLDAFGNGANPTIIAGERLMSDTGDAPQFIPNMPRGNQQVRLRNRTWIDPLGGVAPLGNVGPIAGGRFVYQAGTRLVAVNVATGEPLWTHDRPELTPGGDLLADEHTVVVWPADSAATELSLFRAVDGSAIGTVKLPPHVAYPQPDGQWGTRLVTLNRSTDGRQFTLGLFDPLRQQPLWSVDAVNVADWGVVDGRDFYILQKDQRLRIIDGESGQTRCDLQLPPDARAELATVWNDARRWYVATYREPEQEPVPFSAQNSLYPAVHGVVLAASRDSGELLWSLPVQFQQLERELPGEWPFLQFAAQVLSPARPANDRSASRAWSLLLIEKADGRALYEATVPGRDGTHGWLSEPDQHTIHLATGSIKVSLHFSADPPPPPKSE